MDVRFGLCLLLFSSFFILSSSLPVQDKSVNQNLNKVTLVTDNLAKKLTGLLANQEVRNNLLKEINQSTKRENIIFLDEFLTSTAKISGLPSGVLCNTKKILKKTQTVKKLFSNEIFKQFLISPDIDVYFPVADHRNAWNGSDDLLIGIGLLDDEAEELKVYSVKTGQSKTISSEEVPKEPLLMVSPCEHFSHEAYENLQNSDMSVDETFLNESDNGYIQTNYFRITTTSEPFWKGDPEIYVWVAQYSSTSHLMAVKKYLPGVTEAGVWKHLRGCPTALSFYWDNTYDKNTYYKVMEEDGGASINFKVELFGITAKFAIHDDDDELGSVNVNRDEVSWCSGGVLANCCSSWNKQASTGKALMRLTKAK